MILLKTSIAAIIIVWIGYCNNTKHPTTSAPSGETELSASIAKNVSFENDIVPIMKGNCNPCHFPGGKLYEKLPFDQASVIIDHSEGILKRIKNEEEVKMIRLFVEQNTAQAN